MTSDYPYASSFVDRLGKRRWRYRRAGKSMMLPEAPGHPAFEAAYAAATEGRAVAPAIVRRLPTAAKPRTLSAAWRILTTRTADWGRLKPETRATQSAIAERFLSARISDDAPTTYGEIEIATFERRHVKAILARYADRPHAGGHVLRLLRKLIGVALDEEWIAVDPTHRLRYRPEYKGWRAWTDGERRAFERHWPVDSTPRLAYALALYTGQRRSDVSTMRWDDISDGGMEIVQRKTGKALWVPLHPDLVAVLDATPRRHDVILVTHYGEPFSEKSLGMRMQAWTTAAGIGPGATLHGLRKTLGKLLAESGATTREIMDILGHDDIAHAELYSREAEQKRLARAGMGKLFTRQEAPAAEPIRAHGKPRGKP